MGKGAFWCLCALYGASQGSFWLVVMGAVFVAFRPKWWWPSGHPSGGLVFDIDRLLPFDDQSGGDQAVVER